MIRDIGAMARFIKENDDFAVITHFRPDGDAYGSALATVEMLTALGKRAFPVCDDPVDRKYQFLSGWKSFTNAEKGLPFAPKTALGVDVSDANRMGASKALFESCPVQGAIDHHATNVGFADVTLLDAHAAATGEILVKLTQELGIAITKSMAEQLYAAIATDSGNFSFKDTRPETFEAAAELLAAGADVETLSRRLFRSRTLSQTRLLGKALDRIVLSPDGRVAGIMLTDDLFESVHATRPEAHSIVNYLNEIEGVCIGFTAEQRESEVKISFRGANDIDVSKLAARFNGGGHIAAAGGFIPGGVLEEEFNNILKAAMEYLSEVG